MILADPGAAAGDDATPPTEHKTWPHPQMRPAMRQFVKFCIVGATGYVINLAVFAALVHWADMHYIPAAICSFLVAVTSNYTWNRVWTFRHQRGHIAYQGLRFLVVSTIALAGNLVFLAILVGIGVPKIPAQAIAIALVTPWNFVANKLWSFRRQPAV